MWINEKLHELPFPASERHRIAGACFTVALEHHHAIVILLRERLNGSAFALVRNVYETYVRGVWFLHCATDKELSAFINNDELPKIGVMLDAIEKVPEFSAGTLTKVKASSWNAMCSYAHTGALQVQRWNTSDAIESRHSVEEIEEVLQHTNAVAMLAGLGVAALADNVEIASEFLEKAKAVAAVDVASAPDPIHWARATISCGRRWGVAHEFEAVYAAVL
jgi:hypothetical protein